MKKIKSRSFWTREMSNGEKEYRTQSKVLFTLLPFLLAALLYNQLTVIEGLEWGRNTIMVLVLGIGLSVLMAIAILLVIIVSLIEYLRTFE